MLTIQMNGRTLGHLSSEKTVNHVISGNREVHVIAGFYSRDNNPGEQLFIEEQLTIFADQFREMQTGGLAILPQLAEKDYAEAAFVTIASTEMILIWQDRQKGVYLQRNGELFRLQPTRSPELLSACDGYTFGDFYALKPKEDDLLLFLSPEFVARFKAEQLEEIFSVRQQLHAKMKNLTSLGETYGFNFEQSWFAIQVQRVEEHQIYLGNNTPDLFPGEKTSRLNIVQKLYQSIDYSKATKVSLNPALFPIEEFPVRRKPVNNLRQTTPVSRGNRPQLGDWKKSQEAKNRIEAIDHSRQKKRRETLNAYENRRTKMDPMFDRLRDFSFQPILEKTKKGFFRFFQIWPEKPISSFVFASASILALILLAVLGVKTVLDKRNVPDKPQASESHYVTEETVPDASVSSPLVTNLEVVIVVKVNTLQIRQAPDSESALLLSVNRGDSVTQLAPEEKGWVYVRSADGTEGFAAADYLFE